MTGGAQARLRPSLIPLFTREKKDDSKRVSIKNVK